MTDKAEISDDINNVRRYMDTLTMIQRDREEVENVILGYMSDCTTKDARIAELDQTVKYALAVMRDIQTDLSERAENNVVNLGNGNWLALQSAIEKLNEVKS